MFVFGRSHSSRRRDGGQVRAGLLSLVVAVVLLVGGAGAITWALTHQVSAPQPSPAAAGTIDGASTDTPSPSGTAASAASSAAATAPATPSPTTSGPVLPASAPVSLSIPAISVTSPLPPVGRNADGSIVVPQPGPHYDQAAWYKYSPTPGELGPSVIEGHIDSAANGPSVFFHLGDLKPGDTIDVTRADHQVATFAVNAVRSYPKDAFPTLTVYGNTDHAALRLITCGGSFDSATGHYRNNIVVFAHLVSSHQV